MSPGRKQIPQHRAELVEIGKKWKGYIRVCVNLPRAMFLFLYGDCHIISQGGNQRLLLEDKLYTLKFTNVMDSKSFYFLNKSQA